MCQLLGMNCNTPTDVVFLFEGSVVVLVLLIAIQMASVLLLKVVGAYFRDNHATSQSLCRLVKNSTKIKSLNVIAPFVKQRRRCDHENTIPLFGNLGRNWVFAHNSNLKEITGYV